MVHNGERLPLGLEAGDDLLGVHPQLDDLQRHPAADGSLLVGQVDLAKSTFADAFDEFVAIDNGAWPLGQWPASASRCRSDYCLIER